MLVGYARVSTDDQNLNLQRKDKQALAVQLCDEKTYSFTDVWINESIKANTVQIHRFCEKTNDEKIESGDYYQNNAFIIHI